MVEDTDLITTIDNDMITAAADGNLEAAKSLVASGANVAAGDNCAVRYAAQNGHLEVVEFLVASGADLSTLCGDEESIGFIAEGGHLDVMKFLASSGVDIVGEENQCLIAAVSSGQLEIVKFLVGSGADVKKDIAPLLEAVDGEQLEIARFLVASGSKYRDSDLHGLLGLEKLPRSRALMLEALDAFLSKKT